MTALPKCDSQCRVARFRCNLVRATCLHPAGSPQNGCKIAQLAPGNDPVLTNRHWLTDIQDLIAEIVETTGIEDVYELSPLQQGMLIHTLRDPGVGMYMSQGVFTLEDVMEVSTSVFCPTKHEGQKFSGAWQA